MERTVIILAAGSGSRLLPLTADRPKCMVALKGRPLLEWQMAAAREAGATRIVLVTGYKAENVAAPGIVTVVNPRFATTNMVESLWCAEQYFGDEFTVSYGDIVYEPGVLAELWAAPQRSAVVVDDAWKGYWSKRFDDILSDAETLRVDAEGKIIDIGQKPASLDEIESQYIGLFRLGRDAIEAAARIRREGRPLDPALPGWGAPPRPLEKWYMTDLLQAMIKSRISLRAVRISGRWVEVDSVRDLALAEELCTEREGRLRIRAPKP
jgi:choline kinase